MLFAVAQFHISNTSNGGISLKIYKFLVECYCWVTTSEIGRNISWEKSVLTKMYYIYIYIYIYIYYMPHIAVKHYKKAFAENIHLLPNKF